MMFTHRHADGGFYIMVGPQEMKDPVSGQWVEGVCYKGTNGNLYWTTKERWEDRFEEIQNVDLVTSTKIEIVEPDTQEIIGGYQFDVHQAGNVRHLLISAAKVAAKSRMKQVEAVLLAQAEAVSQGLHIRDIDFPDLMGDVNAFHVKFGQVPENYGVSRVLPADLHDFRTKFHEEESSEYRDEYAKLIHAVERKDHREILNSLELQLDSLVDLVWVALGTADLQFGRHKFHEAWRRVAVANMAKVAKAQAGDDATDSGRAPKYDVVKPAGWTPPDHRDLVSDYNHE